MNPELVRSERFPSEGPKTLNPNGRPNWHPKHDIGGQADFYPQVDQEPFVPQTIADALAVAAEEPDITCYLGAPNFEDLVEDRARERFPDLFLNSEERRLLEEKRRRESTVHVIAPQAGMVTVYHALSSSTKPKSRVNC